jgi:prepilin-type N-terminal cleavage/methylation domain-containing protein
MPSVRVRSESGFSLPELLVVMILIGVLAAIVLPQFLSQKRKGNDAATKSDVRNLVSVVSSCGVETRDYHECDTKGELGNPGFDFGNGPGQVDVTALADDVFEVTGVSEATSGGVNHRYTWQRDAAGHATRTCVAGPGNNEGGCTAGSW